MCLYRKIKIRHFHILYLSRVFANFSSANGYDKTTLIRVLAMYNSNLLTKFQFHIFIFEGLATSQTLLQSMKQNTNRASQSVVYNNGQKMALRAFYFIRTLIKALTYYYINCSQRYLLVTIENSRFGGLIF